MSKNEKSKNNKNHKSIKENTNKEIDEQSPQENKNSIFKVEKKDNKEKEEEKIEVINLDSNNDQEELSQSLQNLLLDENFASPVVVKKENKLITDCHYATFKNSYGENTCYINVILHLLNSIDDLADFLSSLYKIDESSKVSDNNSNKDNNKNKSKNNKEESKENEPNEEDKESYDINEFLVSLGTIMDEYYKITSNENENQNTKGKKRKEKNKNKHVTIIKTQIMRKILEKISNNKFQLNTIADPVELFTFILDILNENLNGDTHKSFYLELIDEYTCETKNCNQIKNKYDKDNFMYHMYIDEILKYIEKDKIKIKEYKNKLFEFSYNSFILGNNKFCEKCNSEMQHLLICKNYPDYLLINCVWRESNPIVDDVIKIFFLMSLKDDINNLFYYRNKSHQRVNYYLLGFILYSFTLSHYVIVKYNSIYNVFVLFDDEIVKEYNNINELINDITVEVLKKNGKAFFYPVMLIYTTEEIYKYQTLNRNRLYDNEYQNLINKCNEAIYEYQTNNEIKEEMKSNNYQKLIEEQKEIEREIKKRKCATEKKKNKSQNNNNNNQDKNKQTNIDIENKEKEKEENIIIEDDDDDDFKLLKDSESKKEKSENNSKSKEKDKNEIEDKKPRSKSKKKEAKEKEEEKKEKNQEKNTNNIKPENKSKKNKNKNKKNININDIIWGIQDDNKKETNSSQDKKKQQNNSNNKYLGKKISNPTEKKNEFYKYNPNNQNKGKTFIKNPSRKIYI